MTAKIFEFPTRTCRLCEHFMSYGEDSPVAGICLMLDKKVHDVHEVASHCPAYEEVTQWPR